MSRIRRYNATTRLWEYVDSILPGSTPIVSFTPQIVVTAPTGSTVTCVKGSTSITATEVSGVWKFRPLYYGDWVVNATNGINSDSKTITIDTVKQYSTEMVLIPSTYTRVSCIQSSGVQYIDTGITVGSGFGVFADFNIVSDNGNIDNVFGAQNTSNYQYFALSIQNSILIFENTHGDGLHFNLESLSFPTGHRTIQANLYNDHKLFYNGTYYSSSITNTANIYNLMLFADCLNGTMQRYSNTKIYKFSITVGDELVRDFIPCYRNSDTKPGMYDIVNDVFYTNQGSGADFTYETLS